MRSTESMQWRCARTVPVEQKRVPIGSGGEWIEVLTGGDPAGGTVAAAHPMTSLDVEPLSLLASVTGGKVYALNGRGLGNASPIAPAQANLEQMVSDLEQARRALGSPRWLWWGMSAGGYIGQFYAHRYPDAFVGLILDSTAACFRDAVLDPDSWLSPSHPDSRAAIESAGLLAPIDDELVDDRRLAWIEVEGVGPVLRLVDGPALLVSLHAPPPAMKRGIAALWSFDSRGWLASLEVPTLVIAGPNDPVVPLAHQRALHAAIPESEYLELEGAGHTPVNERPQEIAAAIRPFMDRVFGR